MAVKGFCKARNESHIIRDTLDHWAPFCDAGIHVYCDCCTDDTPGICKQHPAVVEVIESSFLDPDRERAEYFNRQQLLNSVRRFLGPRDWVVYFDADEHLYDFDLEHLKNEQLRMIACLSFESYITLEDQAFSEFEYHRRRWVGDEYEWSPYFYRNTPWIGFSKPDQRNMDVGPPLKGFELLVHGKVRHWGKGLSVRKWEEKCRYYTEVFGPRYAEKWEKRKGQAVHQMSDFGRPLVTWDALRQGQHKTIHRQKCQLIS